VRGEWKFNESFCGLGHYRWERAQVSGVCRILSREMLGDYLPFFSIYFCLEACMNSVIRICSGLDQNKG
jgi:hypothetical protein